MDINAECTCWLSFADRWCDGGCGCQLHDCEPLAMGINRIGDEQLNAELQAVCEPFQRSPATRRNLDAMNDAIQRHIWAKRMSGELSLIDKVAININGMPLDEFIKGDWVADQLSKQPVNIKFVKLGEKIQS